ncbi:MAG TPA: hypothetical protein DCZ92_05615 [Elusimicrobia bacterium]|nr:MAG: hypothetical protein A2016_06820 [Elusimicrobia bacterium GWF2_62_30]HBA60283.1 hypothetical protein [Elusimicrobiota bacterium]
MKRNMMNVGMAVMALALSFGLSGCGRSKQNASLALEEARLNISAARGSGAQTYAAEPLKEAVAALNKADKAFEAMKYDMAKTAAESAVQLAKAAQEVAEKKAADKKLKPAKKAVKSAKRIR